MENKEHWQGSPGWAWQKHGQGHGGTWKILLQNSDTPSLNVLEVRFFKGFLSSKIEGGGGGWGACGFFKIGTAKGTSVTIANSNSKARDTGVSQSTVIR